MSGTKVAAPAAACAVIDRGIEDHGCAGVCDDTVVAYFYAWARVLWFVVGPDAVHPRTVARVELAKTSSYLG